MAEATSTSSRTRLGRAFARLVGRPDLYPASEPTKRHHPFGITASTIHAGLPTSVGLKGLSRTSTPANERTESGSASTRTTRPTLSILSPAASERAAHAQFLRDRYGIPVLMAPDDGLDPVDEAH